MSNSSKDPKNQEKSSGEWEGIFGDAYQELIRIMPCVGFVLIRQEGEEWQIAFNEGSILAKLGFTRSLLSCKGLAGGFPVDFRELLFPSLEQISEGANGTEFLYELGFETYSVHLQAFRKSEKVDAVVGTVSDLTELVLAERRKQTLSQSGLVLYCLWRGPRKNWSLAQITPAMRPLGYESEDLISDRVKYSELIHPEDLLQVISTVSANFETSVDSYRMIYRLVKADGETRWVHDMTCEMRNHKGQVIYSDTVIVDVTEYKLLEEKLRVSEERFMQAVEGTNDGLWDWDIVNNQTYRSPRYLEILGNTEDLQPNLESGGDLIHLDDRELAQAALRDHLKGILPYFQVEYRVLSAAGGYKWLFVRGKAIWNAAGEAIRIAGSVTDITERKQTEEQLRYLSLHDPLTSLSNRGVFERAMEDLNQQGACSSTGVIVCDVDGLKLYNDFLGHQVGDSIIIATAEVLGNALRQGDIAARIGGDEFGILLSNVDSANVCAVVSRIRKSLEDYNHKSNDLILSFSIGWSHGDEQMTSISDIFKSADDKMYVEKRFNHQNFLSLLSHSFMRKLSSSGVLPVAYSNDLLELEIRFAATLDCTLFNRTKLELIARFHDLGMVTISPRIFLKPEILNQKERTVMQTHAERGYHIALVVPELEPVAELIRSHHEWWNGQGYPLGLKGTEIPWECRVLHLVLAFNAMVHQRPYRKALTIAEACREILRCCGTQFDPELGEQFCMYINLNCNFSE